MRQNKQQENMGYLQTNEKKLRTTTNKTEDLSAQDYSFHTNGQGFESQIQATLSAQSAQRLPFEFNNFCKDEYEKTRNELQEEMCQKQ